MQHQNDMIQDMHIVVYFFEATTKIMTHVLHITILTMRKPLQANFHSMQVYVDVGERMELQTIKHKY